MKNLRLSIFVLVALAQLAVPAYAVWMRTQTLKNGRVWKFRTAPVDPADMIRGRYIALRFQAEEVPQADGLPAAEKVYAVLKEGSEGFAEVERLSITPVAGDNVITVKPTGYWDGKQHMIFPFDQLWVNEKIAPAAEQAYFANSTRKKLNAYVTVRVHQGDAAIEELYLDGKPLKEYLQAAPKR